MQLFDGVKDCCSLLNTHTHSHLLSGKSSACFAVWVCAPLCQRGKTQTVWDETYKVSLCALRSPSAPVCFASSPFPFACSVKTEWAHILMHTDTHAALLHCCVCRNCDEALLYRTNKSPHPLNRSKVAKYQICMNRKSSDDWLHLNKPVTMPDLIWTHVCPITGS